MLQYRYIIFGLLCLLFFSTAALAAEDVSEAAATEAGQVLLWNINRSGSKAFIPDISLIGIISGAYFSTEPAAAQGPNPFRTGFNFQGAELAIQSVVDPYIRADVFFHLHEDEFETEEAFITTSSLPFNLQMRVGKMRARFGRENTQHLDASHFVDYSRSRRYFFGNEGFVEWSAEASVILPVSWYSEATVAFLQGSNDVSFNSASNSDFVYLTHFKNAFDLNANTTFQLGLSGAWGNNATAPGDLTQVYGADMFLRWRPSIYKGIKWQTDYLYRRLQDVANTAVEGGVTTQLVYQFAQRWETGARFDFVGIPDDGFKQYQASPMLTFIATEFFRIRAQYNLLHTDNIATDQHEVFLQMIFNMGPHGAHSF